LFKHKKIFERTSEEFKKANEKACCGKNVIEEEHFKKKDKVFT
jgi:hypothetical protein